MARVRFNMALLQPSQGSAWDMHKELIKKVDRALFPAPCIDPDCGQTTGHAEDCGLSFGDDFAEREKGREA